MTNKNYNPGYNITNDTTLLNDKYGITPEINKAILAAHKQALSGKMSNEKKILSMIAKYPHIPHFKNYLSALYEKAGNAFKAFKVTDEIIKAHPDYLFGKINLAAKYLANDDLEKIPEVLGKDLELQALCPDRDTFHISEVTSFYNIATRYYLKVEDLEGIQSCCDFLEEITEAVDIDASMAALIGLCRMTLNINRFKTEKKNRLDVIVDAEAEKSSKDNVEPPAFNHPEVIQLYDNDMNIDRDILRNLLSMPRNSIIEDLEKVLDDSIVRFAYFSNLLDEVGEINEFVMHAVFLLGELRATESLPVIFRILSQHRDYYDLYLGDFLSEGLWEPLYILANSKLDELKDFVLQPGKYTYAKSMIFIVVDQIAMQEPDRRSEVIGWYQDICEAFNECTLEDNIIDSELLGLMVWHFKDFAGKDALQYVKPLFDKGWVSESVCGSYNDLATENRGIRTKKSEMLPITERYDKIVNSWAGYNENVDDDFIGSDFFDRLNSKPEVKEKKVGRNDPCPCGSGKKYKKCCGKL